jgi:hypothetical protein
VPDDREPKRRARTHPNERDRLSRREQSAPIAIVGDENLTPPPIDISEIEGMGDTVPPPVREQLTVMANWIDKLASERTSAGWLTRIESNVAAIAKSTTKHEAILETFVVPSIKESMSAVDSLAAQMPKILAQLESISLAITSFDVRLRGLEREVSLLSERFATTTASLGARIETNEARINKMELRLAVVEVSARDGATTSTAIAKRDKLWWAAITFVVGGAAGLIPTVIGFVRNHF